MDFRVTRRGLLRLAGFSAGMLALSRVRALPAALAAEVAGDAPGLRVLSPSDARILAAVAERMTFTDDPAMPRFSATDGLRTIDVALRQLPPDVPRQLSWGLWMFEYAPPLCIGQPARFTRMNANWQDVYLQDWADSGLQARRLVFQALKNLSMLGYYAQDATWPGIHYSGPWVVRPRRELPQ
ncbi:hypothetical protein KF840_10955 [bacterium]|nr:hypothetical protein [bacterium]